nr:uncharacterized protein LOC102457267 [Pelodiscus sinensis]|eukprot:XP_025039252.1 uncharacterized protein LOC102457267 [Pelodiscus sinensis]
MLLSLCLLLPALSPSSQEICSAPGTLPAPILNMNQTSARPGESVLFRCSVTSQLPATRIIFCKDGEEFSSQKGSEGKVNYSYKHVVSGGSPGNYTCWYEFKDIKNQVTRSELSPAQHLSVTGDGSSSSGGGDGSSPAGLSIPLGITIPVLLVLAVVLYVLGRKAVSLRRDQREQVQCDTSNTPEDQVQYASVNLSGTTRKQPRPQGEETPTYATIALQKDRRC